MTVAYELTTPSTPAARLTSGHPLRQPIPLKVALKQLALRAALVMNATPQRGAKPVLMQLKTYKQMYVRGAGPDRC